MEVSETERPYLELVNSILEEAALRPIQIKRNKHGPLEIGVSTRLTLWVDCRVIPQIGVWNGEVIENGRISMGGEVFGITGGMITVGNTGIPLNNTKVITWINLGFSWSRGEILDSVWKNLPDVRKIIFLQQQPFNKLEVAFCRNGAKVPYLHIRDVRRLPGEPEECRYMSWSSSDAVALGRSFVLGDCPESVFLEGIAEANEIIRDLVYPKECD